jgi:hypothetical protein
MKQPAVIAADFPNLTGSEERSGQTESDTEGANLAEGAQMKLSGKRDSAPETLWKVFLGWSDRITRQAPTGQASIRGRESLRSSTEAYAIFACAFFCSGAPNTVRFIAIINQRRDP